MRIQSKFLVPLDIYTKTFELSVEQFLPYLSYPQIITHKILVEGVTY